MYRKKVANHRARRAEWILSIKGQHLHLDVGLSTVGLALESSSIEIEAIIDRRSQRGGYGWHQAGAGAA